MFVGLPDNRTHLGLHPVVGIIGGRDVGTRVDLDVSDVNILRGQLQLQALANAEAVRFRWRHDADVVPVEVLEEDGHGFGQEVVGRDRPGEGRVDTLVAEFAFGASL